MVADLATALKKARKPRATVTRIEGSRLQAKWNSLDVLKSPGFEWDGSQYPKPNEAAGPCKAELELQENALLGLAEEAPLGYCCKPELTDTFMALHDSHNIMKRTAADSEKGQYSDSEGRKNMRSLASNAEASSHLEATRSYGGRSENEAPA